MPEVPTAVPPEELARLTELADFRKGDKIRARIDDVVTNQQAAEGLKPWYGMLCKRPTFHDDYLQAFNQPNVTLVDTQGRGLDRITERSEEHTSELQSLMRISYAVFCLKKKKLIQQ